MQNDLGAAVRKLSGSTRVWWDLKTQFIGAESYPFGGNVIKDDAFVNEHALRDDIGVL
jgi:hypothetical protein